MPESYANFAKTNLAGSMTNVTTTLTVSDASRFPATAPFRIVIDEEVMMVTSGNSSTTTWTVTRAQEGTSAVAHSAGAIVVNVFTAGSVNKFRDDGILTGDIGSIPTASGTGRLYFTTPYVYRDSGSAWVPVGLGTNVTEPVTTGFSWTNQGGSTVDTTAGGLMLSKPAAASTDSVSLYLKTVAAPYTLTIGYYPMCGVANLYGLIGPCIADSGTGKFYMVRFGGNDNNDCALVIQSFTNPTTASTSVFNSVGMKWYRGMGGAYWVKMTDDTTNRKFFYGANPNAFVQFYSEASATTFTTNRIGFALNPYNAVAGAHIIHWSLT